ncbi:unnamed protein product [Acidithrix sp. C25]|nr:unnamed protein product [Acidithrix sp. C25]
MNEVHAHASKGVVTFHKSHNYQHTKLTSPVQIRNSVRLLELKAVIPSRG